jgi:Tfp pilus assembly protein PilF
MTATYDPSASNSALGRAWAYHRDGRNDAALVEFERILKDNPNDIDANFGLGLVYRVMGRIDKSGSAFEKSLQLVERELQAHPGEDRWLMLVRMINQRLAEVALLKAK